MIAVPTLSQRLARHAFERVSARAGRVPESYLPFVRELPALLHAAGLCQAVALAQSKHQDALADLAAVLDLEPAELARLSRQADVRHYQLLSRRALAAASWLKRYADALLDTGA